MILNALNKQAKIHKEIYGHFSEHLGKGIYEGIYVGDDSEIPNTRGIRKDVVNALKHIKVPVVRWPGGCFADTYHWQEGIGPKEARVKRTNEVWGGITETNHFGTDEFMDFCLQVGCEPYITTNLGSGTVQEMTDWLEYLTSSADTPLTRERKRNGRDEPYHINFWGIGNESWGGGGNMLAQQYAYEYRKYSAFCGNGKKFRIACGANEDDYQWTDTLMKLLTIPAAFNSKVFEGLSMHYYTAVGGLHQKGHPTEFEKDDYYELLRRALHMDELITRHSSIMDTYDPECNVGMIVDEWGTWHKPTEGVNPAFLYQQNTMRDAMAAALTLNIFNKHAKRVWMANLAQMINVLQALILTEKDKMLLTPTYHVFDLFKVHQDNILIDSFVETQETNGVPDIQSTASIDENGVIHLTVCNLSYDQSRDILTIPVETPAKAVDALILTAEPQAHNTFAAPDTVKPCKMETEITDKGLQFSMPPCSIARLSIKVKEPYL